MRLSLRQKFLWPTLLLIIGGMGLMTAFTYYQARVALETAIVGRLNGIADASMLQIEEWIAGNRRDVESWAMQQSMAEALQNGTAAMPASNQLQALKKNYGYYEDILLADARGAVVAASDTRLIGVSVKDRGYFHQTLQGKTALSPVIKSKGSGKPVFVIAAPVRANQGIIGLLFGVVDLSRFTEKFIDSINVGTGGYAYIVNRDGIVISHPDKTKILNLDITQYDFGPRLLTQQRGIFHYRLDGIAKVAALQHADAQGWLLAVAAIESELLAPVTTLGITNMVITAIITGLAALLIILLVQSIIKPLNRIIDALRDAAEQVTSASSQVAASSQALAQGASEQASSLEESSASLEEMAAITRDNSQNADTTQRMMHTVSQIVENVDQHMHDMAAAIDKITHSSEETGNIIQTIDAIAFQTNLLALNAAVEAARAGEFGKGFAVVAEEVRSLAQRSAEAARSTSELIRSTIEAIEGGSRITSLTSDAFQENMEISKKITGLITEIATSSAEQSNGIDQVNRAVSEMDRVTQQNAANAEESASSAEELNAQALQMTQLVHELQAIANGARSIHTALQPVARTEREEF